MKNTSKPVQRPVQKKVQTSQKSNAAERREMFKSVALAMLKVRPITSLAHNGKLDAFFLESVQQLAENILAEAEKFEQKSPLMSTEEVVSQVLKEHKVLLSNLKD